MWIPPVPFLSHLDRHCALQEGTASSGLWLAPGEAKRSPALLKFRDEKDKSSRVVLGFLASPTQGLAGLSRPLSACLHWRWSPDIAGFETWTCLTVDFIKTRFEISFALRCSENCCALQGQHSEVPTCNVNRLGKLGLAWGSTWESWNLACEFSDAPSAGVGILSRSQLPLPHVPGNCWSTRKTESPCRVLLTECR